jgi:PAS domain-containing protein
MAAINRAIQAKTVFELEHPVIRVGGSLGWTFSRAIPVKDATGEIVEWFGAESDVSERKRIEEALRQSEQRFRAALKNSRIAVFSQDRDLHYAWSYNSDLRMGAPAQRTFE